MDVWLKEAGKERKMIHLKRGINLGGWISQCRVYEEEHYSTFIREEDIKKIAAMGFDHIRVPVDYNVLEDQDGRIREKGWGHLDDASAWAKRYGLNMVIDLHKAYGYDFNNAGAFATEENTLFAKPELQERFLLLWERIARRYGQEDHLAFELLNEVVEESAIDAWNALIKRAAACIRCYAETTPIIYGGVQWNSAEKVKYLEKPEDRNIIFSFHTDEPQAFTHQRAEWVKGLDLTRSVRYPDTMEYYRRISGEFEEGASVVRSNADDIGVPFVDELVRQAAIAAEHAGVPLYCGEFGVIDFAPPEDSLRWFSVMDEVLRRYGIGWAVWTYRQMNFGITDAHYDPIRERLLHMWMR